MKFLVTVLIATSLMGAAACSVRERWPYSAEMRVGVILGMTDSEDYRDDRGGGAAMEILIGRRFHAPDRNGWAGALAAGVWGMGAREDDCPIAPGGGCIPHFPGWAWTAALAGFETSETNARILAGPALVYGDEGSGVFGAMMRLDGALPILYRLSLTATFSTLYVPDYQKDTFFNGELGIGVRIR